ncbi:MAG: hypothetical protein K6A05_06090 [Lachnospiraceae bacterium]|nr:hypothetical protein [Lachnospiraceae bacterium]
MKRRILVLLCSMCLLALVGCGKTAQEAPAPTTEEPSQEIPVVETTDTAGLTFEELGKLGFSFSSGAGGWSTDLFIHPDGSFEGTYHDSDMGDTGDDYPNGTMYLCSFVGSFAPLEKVDDTTYKTHVQEMKYEKNVGEEEIIDDMKYIYSDAYGMEGDGDFYFYLPGTTVSKLGDDVISWIFYLWYDDPSFPDLNYDEVTLPCVVLANVNEGYGFTSSDYSEMVDENITSDLADGSYSSNFTTDGTYMKTLKNIEFYDNAIVVEADFDIIDENTYEYVGEIEYGTYTIAIDENTKFVSGGGEAEPEQMTKDEFKEYISNLMDSGLGFGLTIKDGVATQVGIWS